ncbi:HNH endonuclease [Parvicella tangerina]|uniref:HNH endonuclease n=1 Tax=Parvicella tangerina TaxID=2829795 RepID=A0A916JP13_9FLAO|nr:hypothetical protein [Parvicella tangerina]CAG5083804.1 hypothetical protein CRYO30217_02294 [Parvicella tangerina]
MIGLAETVEYKKALKKHVESLTTVVRNRIAVYSDIIDLVYEISQIHLIEKRNEAVIKRLKTGHNLKHSTIRMLLSSVLTVKIKKQNQYFLLGNVSNWQINLRDFKSLKKALNELNIVVGDLLEFKFSKPYSSKMIYLEYLNKELQLLNPIRKYIFSYEDFRDNRKPGGWNPYKLAKLLNLKTCPYCNRVYTNTIMFGSKHVTRPQLDHFIPQSKEPWLQLSFYNLIPSCYVCNSDLKDAQKVSYYTHLSPYEENKNHQLMVFEYWPMNYKASIGKNEKMSISIKYNGPLNDNLLRKKVEGNIKLFELQKVYSEHADQVAEIVRKKHMTSDKYIESIQNTFPKLGLTESEAYRLVFCNYFTEEEFKLRPFSKMTKDIASSVLKEFS